MRPLALPILLLAACATPSGTVTTPTEMKMKEMQAAARGEAPPSAQPGVGQPNAAVANALQPRAVLTDEQSKKRDELDRRRTELQRRGEDHARESFELESRKKRVELDQAASVAQDVVALDAATREQRLAAEDLARFRSQEKPHRLAEDTLDVQQVADGLLDAREELAQLEMMYSESQLGDATAEIVLNRSKRRLERAQERYRLRVERSDELKTVTLPRDEETRVQAERTKSVALENLRRAQEKSRLEREAALRDLDFEGRKLARSAADITRDQAILDRDVTTWSHELAVAGSPAGSP